MKKRLEYSKDLIIAIGEAFAREEFVAHTFKIFGLNSEDYVVQDIFL
jgi:hypothetical protein